MGQSQGVAKAPAGRRASGSGAGVETVNDSKAPGNAASKSRIPKLNLTKMPEASQAQELGSGAGARSTRSTRTPGASPGPPQAGFASARSTAASARADGQGGAARPSQTTPRRGPSKEAGVSAAGVVTVATTGGGPGSARRSSPGPTPPGSARQRQSAEVAAMQERRSAAQGLSASRSSSKEARSAAATPMSSPAPSRATPLASPAASRATPAVSPAASRASSKERIIAAVTASAAAAATVGGAGTGGRPQPPSSSPAPSAATPSRPEASPSASPAAKSAKPAASPVPPLRGLERAAQQATLIAARTKKWSKELLDRESTFPKETSARSSLSHEGGTTSSRTLHSARSSTYEGASSVPLTREDKDLTGEGGAAAKAKAKAPAAEKSDDDTHNRDDTPSPTRRRRGSNTFGAPVKLHVYDASWLASESLPIMHLGIEIYGCEFSFGDAGVRSFKPGTYDAARRRTTILLGNTLMRRREVYGLLVKMKKEYPGERYRLVGCNCQTFAEVLCERLGLGSSIPAQYVYFAKPFNFPGGVALNDLIPEGLSARLGSHSSSCSGAGCTDIDNPIVEEAFVKGEDHPPPGARGAPAAAGAAAQRSDRHRGMG